MKASKLPESAPTINTNGFHCQRHPHSIKSLRFSNSTSKNLKMAQKVILTPRLRLTLLESTNLNDPNLLALHKLRSDKEATTWRSVEFPIFAFSLISLSFGWQCPASHFPLKRAMVCCPHPHPFASDILSRLTSHSLGIRGVMPDCKPAGGNHIKLLI
jgi:hypothetical protein